MRPCESCWDQVVDRLLEVRWPDGSVELLLLCCRCLERVECEIGDSAEIAIGLVDALGEPLELCCN